jgi:hypothetical protein
VTAAALKQSRDSPVSAFAGLAAAMAGAPVATADRLCAAMAISPQRDGFRSTLNNDGSPLQICVGLSAAGTPPAIRLIGDPAAADRGDAERRRSVELALGNILASHGPELAPLCRSLLDRMLPADPNTRAALGNGGAWLAADLRGHGMALYTTAKWGTPAARWQRVHEWLETTLPNAAMAREALARLAPHAVPVSVGVEGAAPADARVKFYWRFCGAVTLDTLGIALLARPEIKEFLAHAAGQARLPLAAIVASLSFHLASGEISDVKLDLCGHCVRRGWADWIDVLNQCSARCGLAAFPSTAATESGAEIAFVGFGISSKLAPRLNVYLKQPTEARSGRR